MSYLMALPVCIHLGIFRNKKISSLLALTVYFHKEGWKLEDTEKKKNSSEKKCLFAIEINQLIEWCKYDNRMMSMMSETGRQIGAGFFQIFQ